MTQVKVEKLPEPRRLHLATYRYSVTGPSDESSLLFQTLRDAKAYATARSLAKSKDEALSVYFRCGGPVAGGK